MWEVKILDASGKILEALLTVQWKSYKNHINSRSLMGIPSYQLQKFDFFFFFQVYSKGKQEIRQVLNQPINRQKI